MHKKWFFKVLAVLGTLVSAHGLVLADIASDSQKSALWFSKEIGQLMAFQAASTHFLPGDTVGFPGVEAGVAGDIAARKLDVNGFRSLSFDTLKNDQIKLPASIAAPAGLFHVKAGLPWGIDVGFKAGSFRFNKTDGSAKTEFDNKIVGIEVRKRLLGGGLTGVALPDLSLSLGFDHATGELTRTDHYNGAITGGTLSAGTTWRSDWSVGAATVRAVVSKKLLIVTPFAGVGVTKTSGDTTTQARVNGTESPGGAVDVNSVGKYSANKSMGHLLAGVEITPLPFFRINLGGLVAKDSWSLSFGLRAQFP